LGQFATQVVALASPDVKAVFALFAKGGAAFVSEDAYQAIVDVHLPKLRTRRCRS
jgi:hypothetical protein